jgi:hypothetical protein
LPLNSSGINKEPSARLPTPILALDRKVRRFIFRALLRISTDIAKEVKTY